MYIIDTQAITGISTACFYPMLLEDAFDIICGKLKYKVCELFLNTQSETEIKFLRGIKTKADGNGVKISAVHPYFSGYEGFLFFSEYDKRRVFDSIDLFKPFFEAAQFLGSEYVIFHGIGPGEMKVPVEEYNERLLLIASEAKKYNCEILHENLGRVNEYIQDLKNIKFTLDFKHAVHWGCDVLDIIEKMGSNLAHIHLNDMVADYYSLEASKKVRNCRLPFEGGLDYKKIFDKLYDINYIGGFIIEVYRHNYKNLKEISDSIEKLRDFLKIYENI